MHEPDHSHGNEGQRTSVNVWQNLCRLKNILTVLFVAAMLVLVLLVVGVPVLLNAERFAITTNSMAPHYPPGTLVIVQPTDASHLRIGDVVTFHTSQGSETVVTHRIVGAQQHSQMGERFLTQGDNNAVVDVAPVSPAEIIGVVRYAVPWIGHLSAAYHNETLSIALPVLGSALLVCAVLPTRRHKPATGT